MKKVLVTVAALAVMLATGFAMVVEPVLAGGMHP
jgi:hypothetical protein